MAAPPSYSVADLERHFADEVFPANYNHDLQLRLTGSSLLVRKYPLPFTYRPSSQLVSVRSAATGREQQVHRGGQVARLPHLCFP